jgi:hypothetical protein
MATALDSKLYTVPRAIDRVQGTALIVGVVALVAGLVIAFLSPGGVREALWRPYLVAFVFWAGASIGALPMIMLGHLTGGAWAIVLRRIFEAATRTLPLVALLFLPVAAAVLTRSLYPWTFPELQHEHAIAHKAALYLNIPMFLGRTVLYFAAWMALAYFLNRWSLSQDTEPDPRVRRRLRERMQGLSGPGILLFGATVTFAAVDWVMSLEPEWFSTIFGLLVMAGWGLTAFAFAINVAVWLSRRENLTGLFQPRHFHDHGKLLLAFVMLWSYFMFSQYLIIWMGNLPEETPWYLRRLRGGWQYVALALVLFHFALPFVLLLSRDLKRTGRLVGLVALLVLGMRVVDLFWTVAPSAASAAGHGVAAPHGASAALGYALNFILTVGVGGLWVWYFARQLKQRPLLPLGDEGLADALEEKHGHH